MFRKPKSWTQKLVPSSDTQAVEIVRWMFRAIAFEGYNRHTLTREMNRRKISTPRGEPRWHWVTVASLLTNPVYIGTCVNGTKANGKFHNMGGEVVVENAHKGLIDRRTFDAVQVAIGVTKKRRQRASGYVLSGILHCGHCGLRLIGKTSSKQTRIRYYACSDLVHRGNHDCPHPRVRADKLEAFAVRAFVEALSAESLCKIREKMVEQFSRKRSAAAETGHIVKQVKKLQGQIDRGAQNLAMAKAENFASISAVMDGWRAELRACQGRLDAARGVVVGRDAVDNAMRQLVVLRENAGSGNPDLVKAALAQIIERIVLRREQPRTRARLGEIVFRDGLGLAPLPFTNADFAPTIYHDTAAIVARLFKGKPVSNKQIADGSGGIRSNRVHYRLMRAANVGLIERVGVGQWQPIVK
jgi:hypothetical protein